MTSFPSSRTPSDSLLQIDELRAAWTAVQERIHQACRLNARDPGQVALVAVTKTQPPAVVRAARAAGMATFGENYVQELLRKQKELVDVATPPNWHFIGHLQRNKVRQVVGQVGLIHSVDNFALLRQIGQQSVALGLCSDVLLQVNMAAEPSKSGCRREDAAALLAAGQRMAGVRVTGLMTMPPWFDDPHNARPYFAQLRQLRDELLQAGLADPTVFQHLSMGMSGDFEAAIAEGATWIRVGTSIFGRRAR